MRADSYGQVPAETPPYLATVAATVARIVMVLPGTAPGEWARIAYRTVLSGVLRDWVEHGTSGLTDQDSQDLADLTRLAVDVALETDYGRRDDTFIIVLGALIDDWVRNWNTSEDEA